MYINFPALILIILLGEIFKEYLKYDFPDREWLVSELKQ